MIDFGISYDPVCCSASIEVSSIYKGATTGQFLDTYVKVYLFSEANNERRIKRKTAPVKTPIDASSVSSLVFHETLTFPLFTQVEDCVFKIEVWGRKARSKRFLGHTHVRLIEGINDQCGINAGKSTAELRPFDNLRGCFSEPWVLSSQHKELYEDANISIFDVFIPQGIDSDRLKSYLGLQLVRCETGIAITRADETAYGHVVGFREGQKIISINGGDARIVSPIDMIDLLTSTCGYVRIGVDLGVHYEDLPINYTTDQDQDQDEGFYATINEDIEQQTPTMYLPVLPTTYTYTVTDTDTDTQTQTQTQTPIVTSSIVGSKYIVTPVTSDDETSDDELKHYNTCNDDDTWGFEGVTIWTWHHEHGPHLFLVFLNRVVMIPFLTLSSTWNPLLYPFSFLQTKTHETKKQYKNPTYIDRKLPYPGYPTLP